MHTDDEMPDWGACCACGQPMATSAHTNILALHMLAPKPGTGWGCLVCGLPPDGAVALVCDICLQSKAPLRWVIDGSPTERGRAPYNPSGPKFDHIMELHRDEPLVEAN